MSLYVLFFLLSQSDCAVAANSKAQEGHTSWILEKNSVGDVRLGLTSYQPGNLLSSAVFGRGAMD